MFESITETGESIIKMGLLTKSSPFSIDRSSHAPSESVQETGKPSRRDLGVCSTGQD